MMNISNNLNRSHHPFKKLKKDKKFQEKIKWSDRMESNVMAEINIIHLDPWPEKTIQLESE